MISCCMVASIFASGVNVRFCVKHKFAFSKAGQNWFLSPKFWITVLKIWLFTAFNVYTES